VDAFDTTSTDLDKLNSLGIADPPGTWRKKPIPARAVRMRMPFRVRTLEGEMTGGPGDWLVVGIQGERWPVRKEIFEETYEELVGDDLIAGLTTELAEIDADTGPADA
jgi:hypothetical protein